MLPLHVASGDIDISGQPESLPLRLTSYMSFMSMMSLIPFTSIKYLSKQSLYNK